MMAVPTRENIARMVRVFRPHVFHFVGHGGYQPGDESGYIWLEKEDRTAFQLAADDLTLMLADVTTPLTLAVLNACDTGFRRCKPCDHRTGRRAG